MISGAAAARAGRRGIAVMFATHDPTRARIRSDTIASAQGGTVSSIVPAHGERRQRGYRIT
jgi:hypothetical protein